MNEWVTDLFEAVDRMDTEKFVTYIDRDGRFTFGNASAVVGTDSIGKAVSEFFGTIGGVHHEILNVWNASSSVITELRVTYTRKDGNEVTVPCVNVFGMKGDKITDYKIFIDISPVYA